MNIVELLAHQVEERPDAPAIIDPLLAVSFADLDRESRCAADLLARQGLRRGDVVLVFCPMSVPLYVMLLGIFRLGLVAMFVDPSAGRRQIERCCVICPPKAFAASPRAHLFRFVSRAVRRIPIHLFIRTVLPARAGRRLSRGHGDSWGGSTIPADASGADAPALLTFTTGSTGAPKAAVRSHGFLLAQHRAIRDALRLEPGEIDLTTLPIFVLANLASGVTSVIPDADMRYPARADPARILHQIRRHRVTRTVASPAFLSRLATHCLARGATLETVSRVFTGGGPVFPRVLDRLAQVAPAAEISAVYGSTEAEPIALMEYRDLGSAERRATRHGKGLLAGTPVPSVRVAILPDRWDSPIGSLTEAQFTEANLGPGEPGEIVVNGDHVLNGYLRGRGDRDTKFSVEGQRWHRTGDAGYLDASGRLWLLGRCAAAIDDARGRLYPLSVEAVAEEREDIERAALLAEDGRRILIVQLADRAPGRVNATLEHDLAWARLDQIRIARRIPVDARHNAKIDYGRLRAIGSRV